MNALHGSFGGLTLLALAAAATITACGGGGSGESADSGDALASAREVVVGSHGPNVVSTWNEIAFRTATAPASPSGATPEERVPGPDVVTVQLAVYDAVIAIAGTHKPYAITPTEPAAGAGPVAMQAAATEAAYRVLKGLFPSRGALYEAAYATDMDGVPQGEAKTIGQRVGGEVAAGILALRANDGRETALPPYVPGALPGQFRGTSPVNRTAAFIRPFTTNSHAQFRADPPYSIQSEAYAVELNEVKAIAGRTSTQRTAAQEEIARFHTEPPGGFWARNLRQFATASPNLADNARLLAMLWTVQADAGGACFETKYHYNFWRPTSAIQFADTDGNADTQADPTWEPFLPTPNHPEYPAAHGCASSSVMEVLRDVYGTKKVAFSFTSTVTGTTHHFQRTEELLDEIRNARVWGGMHFRSSVDVGFEQAKQVALWMTRKHFRPVD